MENKNISLLNRLYLYLYHNSDSQETLTRGMTEIPQFIKDDFKSETKSRIFFEDLQKNWDGLMSRLTEKETVIQIIDGNGGCTIAVQKFSQDKFTLKVTQRAKTVQEWQKEKIQSRLTSFQKEIAFNIIYEVLCTVLPTDRCAYLSVYGGEPNNKLLMMLSRKFTCKPISQSIKKDDVVVDENGVFDSNVYISGLARIDDEMVEVGYHAYQTPESSLDSTITVQILDNGNEFDISKPNLHWIS